MLAVTLIILVVVLTSRFIQYLGDAVAGKLASDVLVLLIVYRLPDFLLGILPFSLFLGILLAYGRMYADNEMTALISGGLSPRKLLLLTLASSSVVMIFSGLLSFQAAPWGLRHIEQLRQDQQQLTEVDLIISGQFQNFGGGARVTYAQEVLADGDDGRVLSNVFVATNTSSESTGQEKISLIIAESARPEIDPETGARYMRLENVIQYDGIPGEADYGIIQSDVQAILLPDGANIETVLEEKALPTMALIGSTAPQDQAELQWRISAMLIIPIMAFIAVPFSRVNPRQGRFSKLFPAAVLYAVYFILLQYSRDLVADASIPLWLGMWWVHLLFFAFGVLQYKPLSLAKFRRPKQVAV